jgi:Phosphodiester glycosidase
MIKAFATAFALLVAIAIHFGAPAPEQEIAQAISSRTIAPGVTYTAINDPAGPWRIHVVSVEPGHASSVDVALANDVLPGWEKVSSMAKRHGAVAAINADFATESGRPVHAFAEDGRLIQTSLAPGLNFSVNAQETETRVNRPSVRVRLVGPQGTQTRIGRVNAGLPGPHRLALSTRAGSWLERPPARACSARLYRFKRFGFTFTGLYTRARYRVGKVVCRRKPLSRRGGAVVSARLDGSKTDRVGSLNKGDSVFVDWTLGRRGVLDTLGGNTRLVRRSKNVAPNGSGYPYTRNPRTGVGKTAAGKVLLVTVDGRQPGCSVGMTFVEFGRLFIRLGASDAMNLDGGGSTEMVVNGEVKNRPSGGHERPQPNALLVLPRPDPGESPATQGSKAQAYELPDAPRPPGPELLREIARDPASTGGLVAMLQDQGVRLRPELERIAEEFRRYHGGRAMRGTETERSSQRARRAPARSPRRPPPSS